MSVFDKQTGKWLNKSIDGVPKEGKKDILLKIQESIRLYQKLENPNSIEFHRQRRLREEQERVAALRAEERRRREAERQALVDEAKRHRDSEYDNEKYLREIYEQLLRELREARKHEEHVRAVAASQVGGVRVADDSDEDDPAMEDEGFNHEEKIRAAVKRVEIAQAKVDKAREDLLNAEKRTKEAEEAIRCAEAMSLDEAEKKNTDSEEEVDENGEKKDKKVLYYLRKIPQRKPRPYTVDQMIDDEIKAADEEAAREEAFRRAMEEAKWSDSKREREAEKRRRREEKEREKEERRRQKEEKKRFEKPPEYTPSEFNPIKIDIEGVDFKYEYVVEDALRRLETGEEGPLIQKRHKKTYESHESHADPAAQRSPARSEHSSHRRHSARSEMSEHRRRSVQSTAEEEREHFTHDNVEEDSNSPARSVRSEHSNSPARSKKSEHSNSPARSKKSEHSNSPARSKKSEHSNSPARSRGSVGSKHSSHRLDYDEEGEVAEEHDAKSQDME